MTDLLIMPKSTAESKPKSKAKTKAKKKRLTAKTADRHILYEASVQCVEADLDFFTRVYKKLRKKPPRVIKEDFCGTAALAVDWVHRNPENVAYGVDLDRPTLDWGVENNACILSPDEKQRLHLICDNVLSVTSPAVDLVAALNFSYSVFKTRSELASYFKKARQSLNEDGLFFVDCFGGSEAWDKMEEDRPIPKSKRADGTKVPGFTYVWEQAKFNIINHHLLAHIHFKFADGTKIKKAFTYDWRLWTLPELQELLLEAGFARAEVYLEGWDEEADEADGIFRRRRRAENMPGWVGYVVGEV